jgi:hypothetical protein
MKTFKAICAATVLAFSLSISAYADTTDPGEVHTPGSPSPICLDEGTTTWDTATDESTTIDSDISSSLFSDMLWALASMF